MTDQVQTERHTDSINLSPVAAAKVKSLLAQEGRDDLSLRISVQPGGCSGLRYQLFFDERSLDGDAITDFDGVSVVVDRMSVPYLNGAMIDFVDSIDEAGVHHRQPQRDGLLRLRRQLPLGSGVHRSESRKAPCSSTGAFLRFPGHSSAVEQRASERIVETAFRGVRGAP